MTKAPAAGLAVAEVTDRQGCLEATRQHHSISLSASETSSETSMPRTAVVEAVTAAPVEPVAWAVPEVPGATAVDARTRKTAGPAGPAATAATAATAVGARTAATSSCSTATLLMATSMVCQSWVPAVAEVREAPAVPVALAASGAAMRTERARETRAHREVLVCLEPKGSQGR
jgi:hypothetical protein